MKHHELLIYRSRHQDLSVRDLGVSWKQGTAASAKIIWSGRAEPTFSTSDTLPAGVTMSTAGVVSYDGTACTPDTYSWTVTATDGESTVTATVTVVMAYATLSIPAGQSFKFKLGTAASMQIAYTADGTPSFTVSSGSLPSGVTMTTGGLLEYDGTGDAEATEEVGITATMQYAQAATATVVVVLSEVVVPEDYIWYTPYTTDYTEQVHGYTATAGQPAAFSIATDDSKFGSGYLQVRKTTMDNTGLEYGNTAGKIDLSAGNITISLWLRAPNWAQYSQICLGNRPSDGAPGFILFEDFPSSPSLDFRSSTNASRKSTYVNVDDQWHNWVFTRTSAGAWAWHKDGQANTSGTGDTGSIMGTGQNYKVGGGTNWTKQAYFDLAHVRIYDRVLTGEEITELAGEFDDTSDSSSSGGSDSSSSGGSDSSSSGGSAPTDYVFRAPLQTSLDDVSASARTATEDGGSATVGEVKDGVTCTYIPSAVKVKYPIGDVAIGSSPRTVSLWFWTPSIDSAWNTMFCYGTNSQHYYLYAMGYHQSGKYAFTAYYNDMDSGLGTATASTWHNFVTTYDGTAIKVYVDGVLKGSKTTANINTATSDIVIGGRTYSGESANSMWFADIRIYNRAMTDADVAELYAKGINVE